MRIGLINVDGHNYPNLALGKIAAYHKSLGEDVEWVEPMSWDYDREYQSKLFNFLPRLTVCNPITPYIPT